MKLSRYYLPTLKKAPSDSEVASHKLQIRAGIVRKVASGIYSFLPLGNRVLLKIINIVREEMNRFGAQEILMPALQPKELWDKTGRWEAYGPMMMKLKDRKERQFALGPTHEELITEMVKNDTRSYRELPFNLFQIQVKFRDEPRPRFGLIRAREFIMKDAYSFDKDKSGLEKSYLKMRRAYQNIFTRCGLDFKIVNAASGLIGGSKSEEFMAIAEIGEDIVFHCTSCNYSANRELAESLKEYEWQNRDKSPEEVSTPGKMKVNEVSSYLNVQPYRLIKTIIYKTDFGYVAALVPGDRDAVETKVAASVSAKNIRLIEPKEFKKLNLPYGFVGPLNLKEKLSNVKIIADTSLKNARGLIVGSNKKDFHTINVSFNSNISPDDFADISEVKENDKCLNCNKPLKMERAIEVGHIFQLGTSYSKSLDAYFLDENGAQKPFSMGCYGIGISRIISAVIEQNHDAKGIFWPISIAPFYVHLINLNTDNDTLNKTCNNIYEQLKEQNIEVLYDDRVGSSAGAKFADADLIGIPFQVIVGKTYLKNGKYEIKIRKTGKRYELEKSEMMDFIRKELKKELKKINPPFMPNE